MSFRLGNDYLILNVDDVSIQSFASHSDNNNRI